MKNCFIAILVVSTSMYSIATACSYDQERQIVVLRNIAQRFKGSIFNESEKTVSWADAQGKEMRVTYGGCDHLGFTISSAEKRRSELKTGEVFERATVLATDFWDKADAHDLKTALESRAFTVETNHGVTRYWLKHELYDQFTIEHSYSDGRDRVTIFWSRTF